MNPLNRREWLFRLSQFAAAIASPLIPASSKPKHGIVFDGVDELIHLQNEPAGLRDSGKIIGWWWSANDPTGAAVCRDGEPIKFLRCRAVRAGFDPSLSPKDDAPVVWFRSPNPEQSPTFVEGEDGRRGIRFIESEMSEIEHPLHNWERKS